MGEGALETGGLRRWLPHGQTLPEDVWLNRHHAMVALLVCQAVGLAIFAGFQGYSLLHAAGHIGGLLPLAAAAILLQKHRRLSAAIVAVGLITESALLVHIWHGAIEAHFMFFVMIVVLALYEDWIPFLVAAGYVVLHHGVTGALDPSAVYNHPDAIAHPWKWAAIHGAFVAAAGAAAVTAWRLNEGVRAETRLAYRRARDSEERFRGAFEGAPIGMVMTGLDPKDPGRFLEVNNAMCLLTGYEEAELVGADFRKLNHPADADEGDIALRELIEGKRTTASLEKRLLHADGHVIWVSISISALRDEGGQAEYALAQVQDVTESKRAAEELTYQAMHDSLTGLPNRRSLIAEIEKRLGSLSEDSPQLLVLFDLDGFKAYNDTFGHPAGDSLLERLGSRLEEAMADSPLSAATAYRMGGDEFCVLGRATGTGDQLIAGALNALTEAGEGFTITASYGSVCVPMEATDAAAALGLADRRMYARKSAGRASAGRQSADVLLQILSERNSQLGVHLDEVTTLCKRVAERLGLPEEETTELLQAASLHDVGKTAIPDEILIKRESLSEEEWVFMRRHTLIGERILAAAPSLVRASKLVRSSHERMDGNGYPDGLSGEEIPLGSRIISVCDAYDAMTSDRPYQGAITPAEAVQELHACSGTQFDPKVVESFVATLAEREGEAVSR